MQPVLGENEAVEASEVVLVRPAETARRSQITPHVLIGQAEVAAVFRYRKRRMAVLGQHGVGRAVVQRLGVHQDAVQVEDHRLRSRSR